MRNVVVPVQTLRLLRMVLNAKSLQDMQQAQGIVAAVLDEMQHYATRHHRLLSQVKHETMRADRAEGMVAVLQDKVDSQAKVIARQRRLIVVANDQILDQQDVIDGQDELPHAFDPSSCPVCGTDHPVHEHDDRYYCHGCGQRFFGGYYDPDS